MSRRSASRLWSTGHRNDPRHLKHDLFVLAAGQPDRSGAAQYFTLPETIKPKRLSDDRALQLAGTDGKGPRRANSSLVRGRYVLCKARNDRELAVVQDGAVLQADGRIEASGAYDDLARRYPGLDTIGCPRHVVTPGLVTTHHHVGLTRVQLGHCRHAARAVAFGATLRPPRGRISRYAFSAFALVGSGVTAVQHLDTMRPAPVSAYPSAGMPKSRPTSISVCG